MVWLIFGGFVRTSTFRGIWILFLPPMWFAAGFQFGQFTVGILGKVFDVVNLGLDGISSITGYRDLFFGFIQR